MKDFAMRVKNLSTHRFPLGTDPAKECFILNVAAHKLSTAVPGFRRLPLESSVSYDKKFRSNQFVYVFYRGFSKTVLLRQFHLLLTEGSLSNNRCKNNIINIPYKMFLSIIMTFFINFL